MEVVVTTGAVRRGKFQSNRHHQLTNTHFYRLDALPVAQPCQSTAIRKHRVGLTGKHKFLVGRRLMARLCPFLVVADRIVLLLDRQYGAMG